MIFDTGSVAAAEFSTSLTTDPVLTDAAAAAGQWNPRAVTWKPYRPV